MDHRSPGFRVGLTGGIASGKSLVAGLFADLGVPVIDTDQVAREVVEPGQPALAAIVERFGPDILQPDGRLDRRRLRELIFTDDVERAALEAILHPVIRARSLEQAQSAGGSYQLLVVPLLVETDFTALVDRVLVVDCPEPLQLERLLARDAENPRQAARMIAAQLPRSERLKVADDIIDNSGDIANTRHQVEKLHRRYLAIAASSQ
jgi:dephospho-CoA kinase